LVWVAVGRQELPGSALPEVLVPNSIQPFVDRTIVVKFVPSTVKVNGSVTLTVLSSPVSVEKPVMSSGLCAMTPPSDWAANAAPGIAQMVSSSATVPTACSRCGDEPARTHLS
jgi:hypothetical protein